MSKNSVQLVVEAAEKCHEQGKLPKSDLLALKTVRLLFPFRFRKFSNKIVDVMVEEGGDDVPAVAVSGKGYSFDPEVFERLLQILIEYLPKLLEILLPLFSQRDE